MQFKFPFIDVLTIPTGAGPGDARIVIDGVNGRIDFYDSSNFIRLSLFSQPDPDIQYDGRSYPRGFSSVSSATSNSGAIAPGANTDLQATTSVIQDRAYFIHFHSQTVFAAGGFNAVECTMNGTAIGQFYTDNVAAINDSHMIDAMVPFISTFTGAATFRARNNATSSGNITLLGAIDNIRSITPIDLGSN